MGPSSAGAIGWMQFMPDTWLRWGVDANSDGVADPWNPTDAVFSAARYLAAAGGSTDLYRGVYAYNHADWYVREVLGLADVYGSGGTVAFSLDRMQQSLDGARAETARAGEALLAARGLVRRQAKLAARWSARADSIVLRSWSTPDPRCGIGLTLRAFDGQVWTYCHLAVLDPAVLPGAALKAGSQVGLVGATGDASGPHLHLQLQPATSWPQQEAWFKSFAGRAFSWSDSGPSSTPAARALAFAAPTARGPVFEIVPSADTDPSV